MKNIILIVALVTGILIISGCAAQKIEPQPTPTPSSGGLGIKKDVEISGSAFNPSTITILKGASVVWANKDSAKHTIVSDSGDEFNSDPISRGGNYAHTFNTPGTYEYHCSIHPSMKGMVIVE